jgi:hypothetical protein
MFGFLSKKHHFLINSPKTLHVGLKQGVFEGVREE